MGKPNFVPMGLPRTLPPSRRSWLGLGEGGGKRLRHPAWGHLTAFFGLAGFRLAAQKDSFRKAPRTRQRKDRSEKARALPWGFSGRRQAGGGVFGDSPGAPGGHFVDLVSCRLPAQKDSFRKAPRIRKSKKKEEKGRALPWGFSGQPPSGRGHPLGRQAWLMTTPGQVLVFYCLVTRALRKKMFWAATCPPPFLGVVQERAQ